MTVLSEVAHWAIKHPGVWSAKQAADDLGCARAAAADALLNFSRLEPKICQRVQPGVYLIRPPEAAPPEPPPVSPAPTEEPFAFEEFLPDDVDLYPPFKIQIYDHYRSRKGDKWYRFRDERGKRGVFTWNDEDDEP